jgi:two-component system heavy metal sensor histidine kinase CusS
MSSLGRQISIGLAIQSLAVLSVVCAAVYWWARTATLDQEAELLEQQHVQLAHLLMEARSHRDEALLRHKIDDVLVAQDDLLTVEIQRDDGTVFYRRVRPAPASTARAARTALPSPAGTDASWSLRVVLDTDADRAALRLLAVSLIAAAAGGAALISIGGSFLVRRGLRPLNQLVTQVQELSAETLSQRIDGLAQPDELRELVLRFNDLLSRLQQAYRQLESFNADVAHELSTPLATLMGGTEIALCRDRPVEELRKVLASNLEELNRLAGIVRDMLFLARADHGEAAQRGIRQALAPIVRSVVYCHRSELDKRALMVEVSGDAEAAVDKALVDRGLSNLLANAIRHAWPGSCIRVTVQAHADEVSLQVQNDGPPVEPEALKRFFDRFYRGDTSRTNANQHHGLGLSIVAAIARMHGGAPFATARGDRITVGWSFASAKPDTVAAGAAGPSHAPDRSGSRRS